MYYDDFIARLRKGEEPRMVLFFGDSDGVISEGYQNLKDKFRQSKPGGTVQLFEGKENGLVELISAAQTASLFASAQLLVLKHSEKVLGGRSDEPVEALKSYHKNSNPDSCLVFLASGMKKTAKAVKAIEGMGWAVQCSDIPEWKIMNWVKDQAAARGLSMKEEGAQFLVQKTGTDMAYLQRAIEQLSVYVYPRKTATLEEIRELPIPGFESEIFPLLDAVGLRQAEKAVKMMGQLQEGVDSGTVILLYGRIRELLLISLGRARGWSQPMTAEKLGLHPYRLNSLWDQSAQFTTGELKEALRGLIHIQAGVVTGRLGKPASVVTLESWVLRWCRRKQTTATR